MRRIPRRDPVGDSLGLGRPVGSGECEPVIGSTVQRIQLRKETNDGSTPTLSIAGFLMRWHRNHALFFHLNEHTTYIYYIYTYIHFSLSTQFFSSLQTLFPDQTSLQRAPRIANTASCIQIAKKKKKEKRFPFSIEPFVRYTRSIRPLSRNEWKIHPPLRSIRSNFPNMARPNFERWRSRNWNCRSDSTRMMMMRFQDFWYRNQWSLPSPFDGGNYLDGHGIDPVTLHAQLEGVEADEPIWAGVDACHHAYQGVIAIEEGPRHACPLPLGHGGPGERVEGARRVTVRVHPVRPPGLHVQPHPARQSLPQSVQSVGGVVRSTCEKTRTRFLTCVIYISFFKKIGVRRLRFSRHDYFW